MPGDGLGKSEKFMGKMKSKTACVLAVRKKHKLANGVTYGYGKCYAEFGMRGVTSHKNTKWSTAYIIPGRVKKVKAPKPQKKTPGKPRALCCVLL